MSLNSVNYNRQLLANPSLIEPSYNSDEVIFMMQLNPKFKLRQDAIDENINAANVNQYLKTTTTPYQFGADPNYVPGPKVIDTQDKTVKQLDPAQQLKGGSDMDGGFAFLPFIAPLLSSLAGPLINSIFGLMSPKKDGQGAFPPQGRGRGKGIRPPQYALGEYLKRHMPRLNQEAAYTFSLQGRPLLHQIKSFTRDEAENMINELHPNIGASVRSQAAARIADSIIPKGINAIMQKEQPRKGSGLREASMSPVGQTIYPIAKYVMDKMINNKAAKKSLMPKLIKSINEVTANQTIQDISGSGRWWDKIKEMLFKVFSGVVDSGAPQQLGKTAATTAANYAINKIVGKFGQGVISDLNIPIISGIARIFGLGEEGGVSRPPMIGLADPAKYPKGSEDMREKMARLRAMRGKGKKSCGGGKKKGSLDFTVKVK